MSNGERSLVISDLPGGLVIRIQAETRVEAQLGWSKIASVGHQPFPEGTLSRIENILRGAKPVGTPQGTARIEGILRRSTPIEVTPAEKGDSQGENVEHETRMVRHNVNHGDSVPEELANQKPFHVHHNPDGSLELYWLVNSRLNRVG